MINLIYFIISIFLDVFGSIPENPFITESEIEQSVRIPRKSRHKKGNNKVNKKQRRKERKRQKRKRKKEKRRLAKMRRRKEKERSRGITTSDLGTF